MPITTELAPTGEYETMFEWGDGIAIDREAEYARRLTARNSR